jgi:hypothetical protein
MGTLSLYQGPPAAALAAGHGPCSRCHQHTGTDKHTHTAMFAARCRQHYNHSVVHTAGVSASDRRWAEVPAVPGCAVKFECYIVTATEVSAPLMGVLPNRLANGCIWPQTDVKLNCLYGSASPSTLLSRPERQSLKSECGVME